MGARQDRIDKQRRETEKSFAANMVFLLRVGIFERAGGPTELSPEDYIQGNHSLKLTAWGNTATSEEIEAKAKEMGIEIPPEA